MKTMLKKIVLIIAFALIGLTSIRAQVLSPQITCVSVLANGDITLTWLTPANPNNQFTGYTIYESSNVGGPFTQIYTVNATGYLQTSYTYICGCGNAAPKYFYILSSYNNGVAVTSPSLGTVESMFLTLVNPVNGTANLCWNPIMSPLLASSSGIYKIYMEYPATVWTLVGSTTSTCFTDTIYVCNRFNSTINFRVEIADNANPGCVSVSSVKGSIFHNLIVPAIPIMDTMSVDNNNNVMLDWSTNTAPDVAGYVIYRWNGAGWITADTIFGINNTNLTLLTSNAGLDSLQFRVAAFDSCGNISPAGGSLKTMFLRATADICNKSATLTWNACNSFASGLGGYNVYQSSVSAAGPYTYIGTTAPGTVTFSATGLTLNSTYYFKVDAFDVSGHKTSASNRRTFYCAAPIPPQFVYFVTASVAGSNRVDLTAFVDTMASVSGYKFMRSPANAPSLFSEIGFVSAPVFPLITFTDYNANTDDYSYFYKVVTVDSCGFDGLESNVGRTIHLTATGNSNFTNTITWNKYEGWDSVLSYKIFRGINGLLDPTPIYTYTNIHPNIKADDTTYVDTAVWRELKGDGNFYYQIQAVQNIGNIYGFDAYSLSNIAIAKQEAEMFIPNAFTPEAGQNITFVPVVRWADYSNYEMVIFDRFGESIFSTSTIGTGWNGSRHNTGRNCETGVYVYLIHFRTATGDDFQRKGQVTLIR